MPGLLRDRLVSLAQGVGAEMWGPTQADTKLRIAFTRDAQSMIVEVAAGATVDEVVEACSRRLKAWPAS